MILDAMNEEVRKLSKVRKLPMLDRSTFPGRVQVERNHALCEWRVLPQMTWLHADSAPFVLTRQAHNLPEQTSYFGSDVVAAVVPPSRLRDQKT